MELFSGPVSKSCLTRLFNGANPDGRPATPSAARGILPFWTDLAVFCQAARSFKMMLRHFFVFAIFSGYFLIFGSRWGNFEIRLPLPDCKVRLLRPNTKCAENRLGAADAVTPRQGGSAHLEKSLFRVSKTSLSHGLAGLAAIKNGACGREAPPLAGGQAPPLACWSSRSRWRMLAQVGWRCMPGRLHSCFRQMAREMNWRPAQACSGLAVVAGAGPAGRGGVSLAKRP